MNYQEIADAALKYLKDKKVQINYSSEFVNAIKFIKSATIDDKETILKAYEKVMEECNSEGISLRYSLSGFSLGHLNPSLAIQDKDLVMCAVKFNPDFYFETSKSSTPYTEGDYGPLKFRDTYKRVLPKKYLEDKDVALLLGTGNFPIGKKFKSIPLKLRNNPDFFFEFVKTPNFNSQFYGEVDIDFDKERERLKKSVMESKSPNLIYAPQWLSEDPEVMKALILNTKQCRTHFRGSQLEQFLNNSIDKSVTRTSDDWNFKNIEVLNDIIKFRDELGIDVLKTSKNIQEARAVIGLASNLEAILGHKSNPGERVATQKPRSQKI